MAKHYKQHMLFGGRKEKTLGIKVLVNYYLTQNVNYKELSLRTAKYKSNE